MAQAELAPPQLVAEPPPRIEQQAAPEPQPRVEPPVEQSAMPVFYTDPQPLSSAQHAKLKLNMSDASFAAAASSVPIVASEFGEVSRTYPIVFATPNATPIALLGLDKGNVFLKDGAWLSHAYVPIYVRRYPFILMKSSDGDKYALGIDAASPRFSEDGEGLALFDEKGEASELTQQAFAFCQAFQHDADLTEKFVAALRAKDLLIEQRFDASGPGLSPLSLTGMEIVDAEKFSNLDESTIVEWHRNGWLALVHYHLASLSGMNELLNRHSQK